MSLVDGSDLEPPREAECLRRRAGRSVRRFFRSTFFLVTMAVTLGVMVGSSAGIPVLAVLLSVMPLHWAAAVAGACGLGAGAATTVGLIKALL